MGIYKPIPIGMMTSLFSAKTSQRHLYFRFINRYDVVSTACMGLVILLLVFPLLRHQLVYLLFPVLYLGYAVGKFLLAYLPAQHHLKKFRLFKWLADYAYIVEDSNDDQKQAQYMFPFLLLALALLLGVLIDRGYLAAHIANQTPSLTWLLFVLPVLRQGRYGSHQAVIRTLLCAFLGIILLYVLGTAHPTASWGTVQLLALQSAWLIVICLMPAALAIYRAKTQRAIDSSTKIVDRIADLAYNSRENLSEESFAHAAAEIISSGLDLAEVFIFQSTTEEYQPGIPLRPIGASSAKGRRFILAENFSVQDRGLVVRAAREGTWQIVNDTRADLRHERRHLRHPLFPTAAELTFPIELDGRLIGVLDMHSNQVGAFFDDDLEIIAIIVHHLAITLARTQELRRSSGLYALSQTIAERILTRQGQPEVLRAIVEVTHEVLSADSVILYPYDPEGRKFSKPLDVSSRPMQFAQDWMINLPGMSSALQLVMQNGAMYINHDDDHTLLNTTRPPGGPERSFAAREGLKATAALPLCITGKDANEGATTFGILFINYQQRRFFSQEYRRWCAVLVDLAALAIQNVLLQEQTARDERTKVWDDIHDGIAQYTWIIQEFIADLAERYPQAGMALTADDIESLSLLKRCSTRLNQEVQYLIEWWGTSLQTRDEREGHPLIADLREHIKIVAQAYAAQCTLHEDLGDTAIDFYLQRDISKITREAMHNAMRHGHANTIDITLACRHDQLSLAIMDNGKGFDPHNVPARHGGLASIAGIVRSYRGSLAIDPIPGQGTTITITFPLATTTPHRAREQERGTS